MMEYYYYTELIAAVRFCRTLQCATGITSLFECCGSGTPDTGANSSQWNASGIADCRKAKPGFCFGGRKCFKFRQSLTKARQGLSTCDQEGDANRTFSSPILAYTCKSRKIFNHWIWGEGLSKTNHVYNISGGVLNSKPDHFNIAI